MIEREIAKELLLLTKQFPVITIIGPRQAGKTTLARTIFPEYRYCNLEYPEIRNIAENDPKAFFSANPPPLIIDEIQRVPILLSYIQAMSDESQIKGQFILTGSHQFELHEKITQSLAGRTALLTLLPLSIYELSKSGIVLSRDEYLFQGFLPRIYKENLEPTRTYRNYYQTYVERDIKQISNIHNLTLFDKFLHILAGRVGQLINFQSISSEVGISGTTINEWISILEASFIVYRLKPYYENFGKRVIKSSKLYFTDIGLVCYLLGITEISQVTRDPLIGNLFENLIVIEALKARLNQGMDPNLFFYRDNNQHEIDLLYKDGRRLIPIEIKSAMTYHESLHKSNDYFVKHFNMDTGYLIYAGDVEIKKDSINILNYKKTYSIFTTE